MIVFIDTEVSVGTHKIMDYGAVREDGAQCHTHSMQEFNTFVSNCDTLCGHNIINHDLKYLQLHGTYATIDTLPLSPLLFPAKPYHRLLKDDKLQVDELNNPVNDCIKARDLFYDEVTAWKRLPLTKQKIYRFLLKDTAPFRGFFTWIDTQNIPKETIQPYSFSEVASLIKEEYSNKLCTNANIAAVAKHYPVELAYVLALIGTNDHFFYYSGLGPT